MMTAARLGAGGAALVALLMAALTVRWLLKKGPHLPPRLLPGAGALAVLAAVAALQIERWTLGLVGRGPHEAVPLYVALGLWGPLEEGLKLLVLWPFFRRRELRGPLEALTVAALVGAVFALVEGGVQLASLPSPPWLTLGAALLSVPLQMLLSSPWVFVLGRSYRRSNPRSGFLPAWLASVVLHGVSEYLLQLRTRVALLTTAPLLVGLLLLVFLARDTLRPGEASLPLRRARSAPTLVELGELLARRHAPVHLRWVFFGAVVNQGVLVASLALAVIFGNYLGVDFPSVDATSSEAVGPIALLGVAALLAFPAAGFLIARASGVPTLLEPALASIVALVGLAVVLGIAAPIALAMLIASAPVALALSCAGAWLGMR